MWLMKIRRIPVGSLDTNCYILESGGAVAVIDPGDEGEQILLALSEIGDVGNGLVQVILLTHGHFDHTMAAAYLQEKTGAPIYIGGKDKDMLTDPGWMKQFMPEFSDAPSRIRSLSEGDAVDFGDASLQVWETPGHSPGSVCYISKDGQKVRPVVVFGGDLIFRRDVGRTDLPGGNPERLRESISRVLSLPDDTVIYPGHGPSTTVGKEKASFNS